jgi:uncharacterized protein (TIGR00725 family)
MNDISDAGPALLLDAGRGILTDSRGRTFEPAERRWLDASAQPPAAAEAPLPDPVDAVAAVHWLQRHSGMPMRVPVGVIGPRDATRAQSEAAVRVGAGLAAMGVAVICGGRQGVMEAVAEGVRRAGGVSIGLLPDADPEHANPCLTHVIATGLGEARNAVIARSAFCLVAIGDSYGTLSEVALGLQFGKRVFGLEGAARVPGVEHQGGADAAMLAVARHILGC